MTLQDLTHVEVRNQKAARTPKKTCPKCKMQVPVARQRCENCPHQFISNAAPDREARKAARKEKKRLRAHRDGIQAAAEATRAAANKRAFYERETVDFAPDLATYGSSARVARAHARALGPALGFNSTLTQPYVCVAVEVVGDHDRAARVRGGPARVSGRVALGTAPRQHVGAARSRLVGRKWRR